MSKSPKNVVTNAEINRVVSSTGMKYVFGQHQKSDALSELGRTAVRTGTAALPGVEVQLGDTPRAKGARQKLELLLPETEPKPPAAKAAIADEVAPRPSKPGARRGSRTPVKQSAKEKRAVEDSSSAGSAKRQSKSIQHK